MKLVMNQWPSGWANAVAGAGSWTWQHPWGFGDQCFYWGSSIGSLEIDWIFKSLQRFFNWLSDFICFGISPYLSGNCFRWVGGIGVQGRCRDTKVCSDRFVHDESLVSMVVACCPYHCTIIVLILVAPGTAPPLKEDMDGSNQLPRNHQLVIMVNDA